MRRVACLLLVLLAMFAGIASAQEEGLRLAPAPVNRLDDESLQRGARNFVNYCLTCHSAQYMRYNRLTDLGLTEAQITDNLMFATDKIGETMTVALTPANGKAWFGSQREAVAILCKCKKGFDGMIAVALPCTDVQREVDLGKGRLDRIHQRAAVALSRPRSILAFSRALSLSFAVSNAARHA